MKRKTPWPSAVMALWLCFSDSLPGSKVAYLCAKKKGKKEEKLPRNP
jgi:hypothetical protein